MSADNSQISGDKLTEIEAQLASKNSKLLQSEQEVIKLTKLCADLMNKDLRSGEGDSWSLGSGGSADVDVEHLKEKLHKLKQNEDYLNVQIEVLQSTVKIMIHPDDIECREREYKSEISLLTTQVEQLLAANMSMKLDISQLDELKAECKKLHETDEKKTRLIEQLHEKLAKYDEHHSALLESLRETEKSEEALRESLTRIQSSEKFEVAEANVEVKVDHSDRAALLQRLDSLEEKDTRLRDRLQQVEEQEQTQEQTIDDLREELQLSKLINTSQEQTILDLQQRLEDLESSGERKKWEMKTAELEKKYSNVKLLLSQKMEELEFSRKTITSLEKTVAELQASASGLEQVREELKSVGEELSLAKDINLSQEETIKQLQGQTDCSDTELTQSYHQQLTYQLTAEDVEEMQAEYQRETKLLKEEIDKLNKQIDTLTESHQQQLSLHQAKVANFEKELSKSASKLQIAQSLIDELKGQNKKLAHEGKGGYEEKIKDLNMKLQGEKVQNSVHRDVIASMSPQLEKLKCENESLESSLNSLKEKLNATESELTKKKSETETLKSRFQLLEKKLEDSSEVIYRLENSQTSASNLADVTQRLENKTAESDNLAVDLIQLTDKCSDLEKQLSSVSARLLSEQASRNELQNSCNHLRNDINNIQAMKDAAETELSASKVELSDVHQSLLDLQKKYLEEKERAEKLLVSLQKEQEKLREQQMHEHQSVAELQALVVVAAKDLQQLENEKDMLVDTLNHTQANLSDLLSTKADSQQESNQLKEQISRYQTQTTSLREQVANLNSELNRASQANETMVASLKNQIYGLTQDKSTLQSRNDQLVIEVDKILSEKQVYIDEIENLASQLKQCKSMHSVELAKERQTAESLNEELNEAYKMLEEQRLVNAEVQVGAEEQMNLRVRELSASNLSLEKELQSVQLEFSHLTRDHDALQTKLMTLEDGKIEFEVLLKDHNEQKLLIAELSESANKTHSMNSSLKLQISDEQAKNVALLQQLEASSTELIELKQSIEEERNKGIFLANKQADKNKAEIAALQEVMSDICAERDELKKQASKSVTDKMSESACFKSQIEALTKDNELLKSNLDSLQNEQLDQLSSSSAETSILQAQLDNTREQMEKEKKMAHNLKSLSSELQTQLREERKAHSVTNDQLQEERKAHSVTNDQLQAIKTEQLTFKEQVEDLKEKHEYCQQRCDEAEANVKQLEQQLQNTCVENERLSEQLVQAKTEVQNLQNTAATHVNLATELETFKVLLTEKKTECFELLRQNDEIQEQLSANENNVKELSDQLSSLQQQLDLLRSDSYEHSNLDDLKSQLRDQRAVSNLAKAAASLRFQSGATGLSDEQTDSQDDYIEALQSEISMLNSQLSSTKKEYDEMCAHVSDLDEQLSSASSLTVEVEHLREKYVDAVASFDQLRDQLTEANNESDQLRKELERLNSDHENMKSACMNLENEKDVLVTEVSLLKEKLENFEIKQQIVESSADSSLSHEFQMNTGNNELSSIDKEDGRTHGSFSLSSETVDYEVEYQCIKKQVDSLEAELQEVVNSKAELNSEICALKSEKDQLVFEVGQKVSAEKYTRLQREIAELEQKLKDETKLKQSFQKTNESLEENLSAEKQALKESEKEVEKLQMSISMLMTSHETEMTSLQAALSEADCKMEELENKVMDNSPRGTNLHSVVEKLNAELHSLKTCKETVCQLMKDLVTERSNDLVTFQQQLSSKLQQLNECDQNGTSDFSTSLPIGHSTQSPLVQTISLPLSSSPVPPLTSSLNLSSHEIEPLSPVSHYSQLSKSDLVAKLSDQTKHELLLRKHLEEARQSLAFYRSAIDNIIDCLGTAMPSVKKWANDVLNYEDQAFSQQLDALISNESALQRRCHALEMSEKALTESFNTKEQEYQLAIHRLEDMVSILKSSKAKMQEELKLKKSNTSSDAEQQIASLKQEVYELEGSVRKLKVQNEEMQYAYEQECERRQVEEEERCKADQRSRLSTLETVRESEYLAKISSLETKISSLLSTQNELEGRIESSKHHSNEEELRQRLATVERSERALLRKIEILQQSDSRGSTQYDNSLDKPEDLLRQKIWEMEKMEIHLKQQVSDLEHDREELHEIARFDKNTIHELNIQLAESSLSIKNLKAQLARVEQAEEIVCTKLDTAESHIVELEEKLKETLNNEKAMRLQLADVEYSEDSLRFHTNTVERSLDTLQASETSLKNMVDDLTDEKERAVKEAAAWKDRFNELEADHSMLRGQLVESKNREITLKGKVSELAATEASLQTRVREVELENEAMKSQVIHLKKSATGVRDSLSDSLMGRDELNNRIQSMKSMDEQTKSKVAELEADKFEMEKKLQDINIKYVQLQAQHNADETGQSRFSERLSAALANEKKAKDNVVRLEAVVAAYESRQTSGVVERENFQLNAENKNLKEKLKTKERDLRESEEKVTRLTAAGNTGGGTYRINKLQAQVKDLQAQLLRSEQTRASLESLLQKTGKTTNKDIPYSSYTEMTAAREPMAAPTHVASERSTVKSRGVDDSLRKQCLNELMTKVKEKNENGTVTPERVVAQQTESTALPEDAQSAASDDDAAEIASQSSIWEKLEPPVRQSPRPVMSAQIKPSTPPLPVDAPLTSSQVDTREDCSSEVPEESSLWDNLELVAPRKSITQPAVKVDVVFDAGPTAPVYVQCSSQVGKESADEASDLEEIVVPAFTGHRQESPISHGVADKEDTDKEQTPTYSSLAAQATDTKDVVRLKQTITDLERRLKSRETEIRMLRNSQKEIERESSLTGDMYAMKTKLRTLQDQVDFGDKKVRQLREEIVTRDKSLTNRQRENVDLRLEVSKLREELAIKTTTISGSKESIVGSTALSPGSQQRPIQMCTSPPRQTTIDKEPADLYKSMIESKAAHIEQLIRQLDEKTGEVAKLKTELSSVQLQVSSPDTNSVRLQYLDDKYTEVATKCYKMKQERDEWKEKYNQLMEEHGQCNQPITAKCEKCKQLKTEIRRLRKELQACKDKLVDKLLSAGHTPHKSFTIEDEEELSSNTVDGVSSLPEDTFNGHIRPAMSAFTHVNGDSSHSFKSPRSTAPHFKQFEARDYEAIADYNPRYFSSSGRVAQETPIKRGQIVRVLEQADDTGYSKAEMDGRIYLVPLKYLQRLDESRVATKGNTVFTQVPQLRMQHTRSMTAHVSPSSDLLNSPSASRRSRSFSPPKPSAGIASTALISERIQPRSMSQKSMRKPHAPTHLRAEVVAGQKIYIEWAYVKYLDHATRSNGTPVSGFRVFLNGRDVKDIDSAYTTVTSIDLTPEQLSQLHTISVQALGAANVNSSLVHVTFSPSNNNVPCSFSHRSKGNDSTNNKQATKRLFIANYDYEPAKAAGHSQGYKTSYRDKLALKTGDFIVAYGEPKPNGFYYAEVNGKTGYVPEAFIRQVPSENAKKFGFFDNDVSFH